MEVPTFEVDDHSPDDLRGTRVLIAPSGPGNVNVQAVQLVREGLVAVMSSLEPWCVEVSTVSTVSTECRGSVEGVSVDTGVEVSRVSRECRR